MVARGGSPEGVGPSMYGWPTPTPRATIKALPSSLLHSRPYGIRGSDGPNSPGDVGPSMNGWPSPTPRATIKALPTSLLHSRPYGFGCLRVLDLFISSYLCSCINN